MADTVPTIATVTTTLLGMVEKALGDNLGAAGKTRFDTAGKLLSFILDKAEPFLASKIDLADLVAAIADVEAAIVAGEDAVAKFKLVLEGRKDEAKTEAPVAEPAAEVATSPLG